MKTDSMIKVYARLSVEVEVDAEQFKNDPSIAINEAMHNERMKTTSGDDYLPQSWNEDIIEHDIDFSVRERTIKVN